MYLPLVSIQCMSGEHQKIPNRPIKDPTVPVANSSAAVSAHTLSYLLKICTDLWFLGLSAAF